MPNLEEEFKEIADEVCPKIAAQINIAMLAIKAAIMYADQYGIPFYSNVSLIGQPYIPKSYEKWKGVSSTLVATFTDIRVEDLDSETGWEHSQLCQEKWL